MKNFFLKLKKYGFRRAATHVLISIVSTVRVIWYRAFFSDNSPNLIKSRVLQATQFVGKGLIEVNNANLGVWPSPGLLNQAGYIEARNRNAKVYIGERTFINNSFVIIADRKNIVIGSDCLIGPNFFVCDSDFHGIDVRDRSNGNYETSSIVIENDVFIGDSVKILKGVRVGQGSIIGSGSIVVSDVEKNCIYAGVPAKKIKSIPIN